MYDLARVSVTIIRMIKKIKFQKVVCTTTIIICACKLWIIGSCSMMRILIVSTFSLMKLNYYRCKDHMRNNIKF